MHDLHRPSVGMMGSHPRPGRRTRRGAAGWLACARHAAVRRVAARRGFSLMETIAAVVIFAITASGVVLVAAAAFGSQTVARQQRLVVEQLNVFTAEVATVPYAQLVAGTFPLPSPCPDSGVGVAGTSCLRAVGDDVTVTWSVDASAPDAVTVTATASLKAAGEPLAVTRSVTAPPARLGTGVGLVRVEVDPALLPTGTPVYALTADTPRTTAGSALVGTNGVALVAVPASSCPRTAPCSLSLDPTAAGAVVDGRYLTGPAARARVVVTAGQLTPAPVGVATPADLTVTVTAEGAGGEQALNPVTGSVCLWVTFRDDAGRHTVPTCNTVDAGRVTITGYQPDPSREETFPLPAGATASLTADSADGTCPQVTGQRGFDGDGWVAAAVCTSWTWGTPGRLSVDGSELSSPTATFTTSADQVAEITWVGSTSRPAVGFGVGAPLWAKPRTVPACADDASCVPVVNPEADICPGELCLSTGNVAPYVAVGEFPAAPRTVAVAGLTRFTLTATDPEDTTVTATVTSLPPVGELFTVAGDGTVADPYTYTPVEAGDPIMSGNSPRSVMLAFDTPPTFDRTTFTVNVTDASNTSRSQTVDLVTDTSAVASVVPLNAVTVAQGDTASVTVRVTTIAGERPIGVALSGSANGDLNVTGATTGMNGVATLQVAAPTTPAGSYLVTVAAANGVNVTVPVQVTPTAAQVTQDVPATVAQNGSSTAEVTVLDRAGVPMADAAVRFTATVDGLSAAGVTMAPAGCRTASNGTCSVTVTAAADTAPGAFLLTATAGTVTTSDTVTVTIAAARVQVTDATVAPGGSAAVTITVTDAAGRPVDGETLTVTGPQGWTVTPSTVTTGAAGTAQVTVAVPANSRQGPFPVTVTTTTALGSSTVTVTGVAATLTAEPLVFIDGAGRLAVTARDTFADPVSGVVLSASATGGIKVVPQATTGVDGTATFIVVADSAGTVTITAPGVSSLAVAVTP